MMNIKDARSLLPKVGDVRREIPTIGKSSTCMETTSTTPMECTVVEVNAANLWYRVKFKDSGWYECYKVPRLKLGPQGGLL